VTAVDAQQIVDHPVQESAYHARAQPDGFGGEVHVLGYMAPFPADVPVVAFVLPLCGAVAGADDALQRLASRVRRARADRGGRRDACVASVLLAGGRAWGEVPKDYLLYLASGAAFASVVLGQLANAFACRSQTTWAFGLSPTTDPLLLGAVAVELGVLLLS